MSSKNKKIKRGSVELNSDEFAPRNVKERITIFIDQDILDYFRDHAKKTGSKYQSLINQALREATLKPSLEERIATLEKQVRKIAS